MLSAVAEKLYKSWSEQCGVSMTSTAVHVHPALVLGGGYEDGEKVVRLGIYFDDRILGMCAMNL